MRQQARERLARAKALIVKGDTESVRYACLELRLAIEYLAYQQLQAYLAEVPDEAMRKWTPRQVIEQMREVDPNADKSSTLFYGKEETYGVPAKEMSVVGEDRRFSLKWANTNHNALGNFLHAPSLHQLETGQAPSAEKMLRKASEIAATVQHILDTPLFNVNFGVFFEFNCDCGGSIKRRDGSFKKRDGIKCPSCGAIHDVVGEDKATGQTQFSIRKISYKCETCSSDNWIGVHRLNLGTVLICANCDAKARIIYSLALVDQPAGSGGG